MVGAHIFLDNLTPKMVRKQTWSSYLLLIMYLFIICVILCNNLNGSLHSLDKVDLKRSIQVVFVWYYGPFR